MTEPKTQFTPGPWHSLRKKTGLSYIPYGTTELCRAIEAAVLKKNNLGE